MLIHIAYLFAIKIYFVLDFVILNTIFLNFHVLTVLIKKMVLINLMVI